MVILSSQKTIEMRYELSGTLTVIKDLQVVNDRFKKREFVVMIDEEG